MTMNSALSKTNFEFCNDLEFNVGHFLTRFNAIFTLNQDLFLERHYLYPQMGMPSRSQNRLDCALLAGVDCVPNANHYGDEFALHARYKPSKSLQGINPRIQPIFKLHGSINWTTDETEPLVVMGEGKEKTIMGS